MTSPGAFSHAFRLVICENCGAPYDAPVTGGEARCRYCSAVMVLAPRRDEPERARTSAESSEEARREQLGKQVGDPAYDDPARHFRAFPELARRKMDAALEGADETFALWKGTAAAVRHGFSPEGESRLFALTLLLVAPLVFRNEFQKLRAVYETTLELARDATIRHELFASLVTAALRDGDVAAAEDWLRHVDDRSDLLEVDSASRVARAGVCLARSDFAGVLATLGESRSAAPPTYRASLVLSGLLRAHALEALGRPKDADAELAFLASERFGTDSGTSAVFGVAEANRWRSLAAAPVARLRSGVMRTGRIVRAVVVAIGVGIGWFVGQEAGWPIGIAAGLALPGLMYGVVIANVSKGRRIQKLRDAKTHGEAR